MKRIYFVRHGQTNSNANNIAQDSSSELSEKGLRQAEYIAKRLEHVEFSNFFTSDFKRADQTASVIGEACNKKAVFNPLLRELKRPSQFLGVNKAESTEYQEYLRLTNENVHDPTWHYADEENFFDVLKRINDFLSEMNEMEGDTVAVSHSRYITMVTLHVVMGMNLTPQVWKDGMNNLTLSNTGITVLEFHEAVNQWKLLTFNDHAHFAE